MCGIAGILRFDQGGVSHESLTKMLDVIAHRGPDGSGVYVSGCMGLGHRRLSIIDLSDAGRQPMCTLDKRFVLSYNGEIYNYKELREELEKLGHKFRSNSDSEVVLIAFVEWGEVALERFNGMFALALWDDLRKELLLARDRYGIKPLYFFRGASSLVFGSEVKALFASSDLTASLNVAALGEYLTFQNFLSHETIFEGVEVLPPGSLVRVGQSTGAARASKYWDFDFTRIDRNLSMDEAVEELSFLFRRAVKRQLVADVDVGAYLSGGMDSGSIVSISSQHIPLRTFTCGFDMTTASSDEASFDERRLAERISSAFNTEHYEVVVKAVDMERSLRLVARHLEEPRVGQSYPNFYASKLASKFNKVVLCGTGGDELFAGYPWRYSLNGHRLGYGEFKNQQYSRWHRLVPETQIYELMVPLGSYNPGDVRARFENVFSGIKQTPVTKEDYLNSCLYFEAKTFLPGLLHVEDKLSMAHSLESRVPFLDNDLVAFAQKIPVEYKLSNFSSASVTRKTNVEQVTSGLKTSHGKYVFREAMVKHLPKPVIEGKKQGFSAPDASWFKKESAKFVADSILCKNARINRYLDRGTLSKLVQEHFDGMSNRRLLIWSLLSLENIFQEFDL